MILNIFLLPIKLICMFKKVCLDIFETFFESVIVQELTLSVLELFYIQHSVYNPVIIIHWLVFYSSVRVIPKNLLFHRILVLIIFFGRVNFGP